MKRDELVFTIRNALDTAERDLRDLREKEGDHYRLLIDSESQVVYARRLLAAWSAEAKHVAPAKETE